MSDKESTKLYTVKLAKNFASQVADGTRLSNLRHTRAGVTLSSPGNTEATVELTKDQVEAIKNDPAFEIKAASSDASASSTGGAKSPAPAGTSGQAPAKSATPTPATTTPAPTQGDGSQVQGTETDPNLAEKQGAEASADGTTPASEITGGDATSTESTDDGVKILDEAALKALKKGNRDGAVAAATERGIEVSDGDTKAQIVDKIAEAQSQTQE